MKNEEEYSRWSVSGLRTKYSPKNRIGHGFLIISPWVDILLLLMFLVLLDKTIVLQPGVVIDLKQSSFGDATRSGFEVVIMSVKGMKGSFSEDIVYYDDVRFRIENAKPREELMLSFKDRVQKTGNSNLVIFADQAVAHGTIVEIMNLARQAGVSHVNMATSPVLE
ncbi:MAG: biopolymer transporter ExbD [Kiritimatiellae bacterium]|nr:biopolymer transporter ExbD [Kiritimatiellia bacterium]